MSVIVALDTAAAAEATGMSEAAIKQAIRAGKLRAKRTGENGGGKYLISPAQLEAWFEGLEDA